MFNKHWQSYKEQVIPKEAGEVQLNETERAFYSGALALFNCLLELDESTKDSHAEYNKRVDQLSQEI